MNTTWHAGLMAISWSLVEVARGHAMVRDDACLAPLGLRQCAVDYRPSIVANPYDRLHLRRDAWLVEETIGCRMLETEL